MTKNAIGRLKKVHEKDATNERIHDGMTIKVHDHDFQLEWFHPNPLLIHPDEKEAYHDRPLHNELVHKGPFYMGHAQGTRSKFMGTRTCSSGTLLCPKCGSGNCSSAYYHTMSWVSTFQCRECNDIKAPCSFYHCHNCCDRGHSGGIFVKGCRGMFHDSCGNNSYRSIVKIYETVYWCCEKSTSAMGCVEKCKSCEKEKRETGCFQKFRYLCCEGDENSKGCRELWKCCKKDVLSATTGCKLACCKDESHVKGCKQQYSCCKKPYEAGKEHENGCKNEWTCCKVPEYLPGCKLKWSCCNAIVSLNNPNDEEKACQQVCKECDEK